MDRCRRRRPAAASSADAPRASAASTAAARIGTEPMFTSATPGSSPVTAATPTIAQSCARRLNFWNAQPAPLVLRTRTSVITSSGASAVSRNPSKNSEAGIVRSPPGPRATIVPPSASTTAGRSDAGSPWASEPPSVPRCRTCGSPTSPAAAASSGTCSAQDVARLDVVVTRERADRDVVARVADVGEVAQAADVDEHRRRREPQLHERQERVAAGEDLGFVAVLGEQRDRFVDGVGAGVVELGGDHAGAPASWPRRPR